MKPEMFDNLLQFKFQFSYVTRLTKIDPNRTFGILGFTEFEN